jgi:glycerophosphoryl diester phosphodiesterase
MPTSASFDEITAALKATAMGHPLAPGAFAVYQAPIRYQGQNGVHEAFVRAAVTAAKIPVQVWIVDDPREMRQLISWGVTGLISDRPDVAVEIVRERA